jgi:transposase InsO family protein
MACSRSSKPELNLPVPPICTGAADATYVPTAVGFLYLGVVLDVFSRRVVGWAMGNHLHTGLMPQALDMALAQRHPNEVIHHSDQGRPIHLHHLRQALP